MGEGPAGGDADQGVAGGGDRQGTAAQGKSCKGCLYYSSLLKTESRSPLCIGLSRPLKNVPSYIVGESEIEADKEGRSLSDFKYVCVGYSVFLNNKDGSTEDQDNQAKLPFCAGLELLVDKRTSAAHVPRTSAESVSTQSHNTEEAPTRVQPVEAKPAQPSKNSFFNKFSRSAEIVAFGVARNLVRVGYSIKNNFEDIVYDRRRPK
ncbi:hypothetical protein Cni_G14394 [Canna indica]|uniref:DUF8204 domain-containing protein n=1 Tax=Canna indica TaxID=4628 RepID=A0AAQ3KC11_9LILI|nr:hypothetical protein Cni_G14394 [Canna indica]